MEGEKKLNIQLTPHFSKKEFACQCGCGDGEISMVLVQKLEQTRVDYGKSMRINSGIRCIGHNRDIGSKDTSSHIKCVAADVGCTNMEDRLKLLPILLKYFTRIGINKSFIHVDVDSEKPNGVFVY
tara:strand:+ start:298 stop:675 length:378 start_codon:yes stop_codon:yes gene_type:complete